VIAVHTSADQHKAHGAPGVDQPSNPDPDDQRTNRFLGWVIVHAALNARPAHKRPARTTSLAFTRPSSNATLPL
jgi:hypothetical protein